MNRHQRRANAKLCQGPPDSAAAEFMKAATEYQNGRLAEAEACYRRVLAAQPHNAEAHSNLSAPLRDQGKLDEAIAACRQAIRIKPDLAEAHSNLAAALRDQGKLDEAVTACHQAIRLKPNLAEARNVLALLLMSLGRLSESRAALEQAIQLAPRNAKYRRHFCEITQIAAESPHLLEMERLAQNGASLSVSDRIDLHFALAKAYEDVGRDAEAFRQWLAGNTLRRRQIAYDEPSTLRGFDRLRAVFTPELIRTRQQVGHPSATPVFIVGMARSGTTLIEQILASHPQVLGGGEVRYLRQAVEAIRTTSGSSAIFPELVPGLAAKEFHDLGTRYLAEIQRHAPAVDRFTDKMLGNFIYVGLIHLVFPNAAIIHTIRDPIDTCLSCYSKLFAKGQQHHTYDLAELGRYYRCYQALMAHWYRVLPPGRILDVRYEDVVADLDGLAQRIVRHCGLEWDPRCLFFHRTVRPVFTASAAQVRQPIYSNSVGRWRRYAALLQPLLAELQIGNGSVLGDQPATMKVQKAF